MTNLFFSLPTELITEIYEYDATHHDREELFQQLTNRIVFKNKYTNKYIIIDVKKKKISTNNPNLYNPIFLIPMCSWSCKFILRMVRKKILFLVYPMDEKKVFFFQEPIRFNEYYI